MNDWRELLKRDFAIIQKDRQHLLDMIFNGDEDKILGISKRSLIEKALDAESFRVYLFNAVDELVMLIPAMDQDTLFNKFVPFEERFALTDEETVDSLHEFILTRRNQLADMIDDRADIEDVFSVFIFSGDLLLRSIGLTSTGAVAFALAFGQMSVLNYDEYYFGLPLEAYKAPGENV